VGDGEGLDERRFSLEGYPNHLRIPPIRDVNYILIGSICSSERVKKNPSEWRLGYSEGLRRKE
jgi:hypothetical protein